MKVNFKIIPENDRISIFNDFILLKLKEYLPSKEIFIRFFYNKAGEYTYLVILKLKKINVDLVIQYLNNTLSKENFQITFPEIYDPSYSFFVELLDSIDDFYYIKIIFRTV